MHIYRSPSHLKPRLLFLIDGLGALVTTSLLWGIVKNYHQYFGMPAHIVTYLYLIACIFCLYSTLCFLVVKRNWKPFLRAIGVANLLYCCITLGLVIYYYPRLTVLGMGYFMGEMAIVCILVFFEFRSIRSQ